MIESILLATGGASDAPIFKIEHIPLTGLPADLVEPSIVYDSIGDQLIVLGGTNGGTVVKNLYSVPMASKAATLKVNNGAHIQHPSVAYSTSPDPSLKVFPVEFISPATFSIISYTNLTSPGARGDGTPVTGHASCVQMLGTSALPKINKMIFFGGSGSDSSAVNTPTVFHIRDLLNPTNVTKYTPSAAIPRGRMSRGVFLKNKLYIAGGKFFTSGAWGASNTFTVNDFTTNTQSVLTALPRGVSGGLFFAKDEDTLWYVGGTARSDNAADTGSKTIYEYKISTNTWTTLSEVWPHNTVNQGMWKDHLGRTFAFGSTWLGNDNQKLTIITTPVLK